MTTCASSFVTLCENIASLPQLHLACNLIMESLNGIKSHNLPKLIRLKSPSSPQITTCFFCSSTKRITTSNMSWKNCPSFIKITELFFIFSLSIISVSYTHLTLPTKA